MAKSDVTWGAT